MTGSAESETLTESLLSAIRLQRHLAARIFISTQEPTVSPGLLDLCSATIVHRFTSPAWLKTLSQHLAGASPLSQAPKSSIPSKDGLIDAGHQETEPPETGLGTLLERIVALRPGEALLFSPTAAMHMRLTPSTGPFESYTGDSNLDSSDSFETSVEAVSRLSTRDLAGRDPCDPVELIRLGLQALPIQIRKRVTEDGGRSKMAS